MSGNAHSFLKELVMMHRVRHPNIVTFYGVTPQPLLIVMEYCKNGSFRSMLMGKNRLSVRQNITIIMAVFRALGYLYGKNILHRDVKSANILVGLHYLIFKIHN